MLLNSGDNPKIPSADNAKIIADLVAEHVDLELGGGGGIEGAQAIMVLAEFHGGLLAIMDATSALAVVMGSAGRLKPPGQLSS